MEKIDLIIICVLILVYYAIRSYRKKNIMDNDVVKYSLSLSAPLDADYIFSVVDKLIMESLDKYKVFTFGHQKPHYINSDEEKKMIEYIVEDVSKKISPTLYDRISLVYKRESIPDLFSNKIMMTVSGFVVDNNTEYSSYIPNENIMS